MSKLHGVITALPVPLNKEGQLASNVLERHIEDSIDAGVTGFWVNGATGCGVYLSVEQRKQVLDATVSAAAGRVPFFAMVSAMSLRDGIALAEYAGQLEVHPAEASFFVSCCYQEVS